MRECPHCMGPLEPGEVHKDHNDCLRALNRRLLRLEGQGGGGGDLGSGPGA